MGAYNAVADDALSLFHNPGGLGHVKGTELRFGLERLVQAGSPMSGAMMTTARPVPNREGAVAGLGWYGLRGTGSTARDVIVAGWSQPLEPLLGIPVLVSHMSGGANLRLVSVNNGTKRKSAFGGDAGVQWSPAAGTRLGVAALGLTSGLKDEKPVYSAGGAYEVGLVTLAADVRSRDGVAIVYPGAEFHMNQGLLDLRIGKGVPVGGISQIAFGWGVNLDPWVLDMAMSVPWNGLNLSGGTMLAGGSFRFGTEPYTARFLGRASQAASRLESDTDSLRAQRELLQKQVADLESSRALAQQELRDLKFRIEEDRLRAAEAAVKVSTPAAPAPAPSAGPLSAPAPKARPPETWPKKHRAVSGETLRGLAGQYYGDPGLWELIYEANPGKILRGLPESGADLLIPNPKR